MADASGARLGIVSGSATPALAGGVARALGVEPVPCEIDRFPDGEVRPAVAGVVGDDVYVVQSTCPPVAEHLVELLLLIDACRRAGAERVTAVVPYFGYARQDRRAVAGQAIGSRVVAEALAATGTDRLVVVDPHVAALEAIAGLPTEIVTATPALAAALAPSVGADAVLVAPDLGAVKLAESYAAVLGLPVAVVRKTRVTGATVVADELVGDVDGRAAIIVDDMISTGGTIVAAAQLLASHGAAADPVVSATHGPLTVEAGARLHALPVGRLLVTDSCTLPGSPHPPSQPAGATEPTGVSAPPMQVVSLAPLLAAVIARLHG